MYVCIEQNVMQPVFCLKILYMQIQPVLDKKKLKKKTTSVLNLHRHFSSSFPDSLPAIHIAFVLY